MIRFKNTVVIGRPGDEVFSFLSNFENMPKWNYFVLEVRKLTDGPVGLGSTFHQVRKSDEQQYRIVEFEPDRTVAVETLSAPHLRMRFALEPEGGGTKLTDEWELQPTGLGLLAQLAAGKIRSAVAENLGKLKELLETRQVTLQDGRRVKL
jgi:carbon monoxide dehydrogenase subunit G